MVTFVRKPKTRRPQAHECGFGDRSPGVTPPTRGGAWPELAAIRARRAAAALPGSIALIGDSLAAQWPTDLRLRAGPIVNLGIGGDRIQDVRWRLTAYPLGSPPPGAVVLIAGVNNVPGEAPSVVVSRLGELSALILGQAPDCDLVVVGVPPRGPTLAASAADIAAVNAGVAELAPVVGFRFVCINDALVAAGGPEGAQRYFRDRAHFSRAGYELLAEAVQRALAEP